MTSASRQRRDGALGETRLADGEWHRLHPATPLLRGGIAIIAIIGALAANFRERVFNLFLGADGAGPSGADGDPLTWIVDRGYIGVALLIAFAVVAIFVAGFYASWRMRSFRITDEVVEVRGGILFRSNRRARLDRIQGINIVRPFFSRLLGAAKLEVTVAGHDANVQLSYLSSAHADQLRRDILRLASGSRAAAGEPLAAARADGTAPSFIERRAAELLAPELDREAVPVQSVVAMHTGRLIGSIVLNDTTFVLTAVSIAAIVVAAISGHLVVLFAVAPLILGVGSFAWRRFTKSLRYSIASTPDGVRVGFGLLTTSNETLPPGRIHSVRISQPLLWRGIGWWEVTVNRASKSSARGADGRENTTILPVGNLDEVLRVLALVVPGLADPQSLEVLRRGLESKGGDDGFVNSSKRAAPLRWFSWRRNGYLFGRGVVLLREGVIWRRLIVVPQARVQSIALHQGPIERALGLASVRLHTVAGPIRAHLGALDRQLALDFFTIGALAVVDAVRTDTSHRWRASEGTA